MNRKDLTKEMADRLSITQAKAARIIDTWEKIVAEGIAAEGSLSLMGFGTFSMWEQTERIGRNPKNGVACVIRPRNSVKFKPGKNLFRHLNMNLGEK